MKNIWVISDTHFFHDNIIKYCDRPFKDSYEMDEAIRDNWNKTVKQGDIVYHCGDVYFGKSKRDFQPYEFLRTLNGQKRLILGNHDDGCDKNLYSVFKKILHFRMFPEFGIILSHSPLHFGSFGRAKINCHGHTHNNLVLDDKQLADERYKNICVEHTNYTPIHIDELRVV